MPFPRPLSLFIVLGNLCCSTVSQADVFSNVAETAGYSLLYSLNIPTTSPNWNTTAIPYSVNNAASVADYSFSRVGYYLEVQAGAGPLQWVYASFNATGYTGTASRLGVPNASSGAFFQRTVSNMNVFSNVAGITNATGIATGNVEFWPSSYNASNAANVPNASASAYDFGDGGAGTSSGYGSMQIHNYDLDGAGPGTAGQTLFAYNRWGQAGTSDLGIGSQSTGNPDWTFNYQLATPNITTFTVRNLQVVVGGGPQPKRTTYMPLGDSITEGSGASGGYRNKLYSNLVAANPSLPPDFVGSSVTNSTSALVAAGEQQHEGHGGYTITNIDANLDGNDARAGNNGGFWLTDTNGTVDLFPDVILLHIGTNDISGVTNNQAGANIVAGRLDLLIGEIIRLAPDSNLIVSSIILRNDVRETVTQLYNAMIPGIVQEYAAEGAKISFFDMHSLLTTADLVDTLHPNQTGYNKMADGWAQAIAAVPEPSSAVVLAGSILGLLGLARRREAKSSR